MELSTSNGMNAGKSGCRLLRVERPRVERRARTSSVATNAKHAKARKTTKLHLSDLRGRRLTPTNFIDNGFECIPLPTGFTHRVGNGIRQEPPTPSVTASSFLIVGFA